MNADELRAGFTGFYAARGHSVIPSASLIPHERLLGSGFPFSR